MTRSARRSCSSRLWRLEYSRSTFEGSTSARYRRRSSDRSSSVTRAPRPAAIFAAFAPTTPPPMISTSAGSTPGTPPSRIPLPPYTFSRYFAPSCTAIRPATSLDRKSTRLNSSHLVISYAVFCLKKKKKKQQTLSQLQHTAKTSLRVSAAVYDYHV